MVEQLSVMKKAVYAGSFDPITNGHLWMIEEGVKIFDHLVVAIGGNPDKKYTFSLDERFRMLKESIGDRANITVDSFDNQFLVNYAASVGAQYVLRGIRSEADYEYERGMRLINGDLLERVTTVFLMPPREIAEVSSSLVKGLIGPKGWQEIVKRYIPPPVYAGILNRYD
jgi:pantetheine-phosphate adenylyltransferase